MVAISRLKPGDIVYDVGRTKMGNTTITRIAVWPVHIVAVHEDGSVTARWNYNAERKYWGRSIRKWRRTMPKARK